MSIRGQKAPEFSAITTRGETFTLSAHQGKVVVLFFFPAAFSPLCTREVAEFAKAWRDFADLGAEVVGISLDDQKTQCEFAAAESLPYALVSDPQAQIAKLYEAKWPAIARIRRITYVIDPDRIVRNIFRYELRPALHATGALDSLKDLRRT